MQRGLPYGSRKEQYMEEELFQYIKQVRMKVLSYAVYFKQTVTS